MQAIWKRIYALVASPFRLTGTICPGADQTAGPLAGRYTKPGKLKAIEPSADYLIG